MVGAMTNRPIARLLAAGTRDTLPDLIRTMARMHAVHLLEYDGDDEGLSLGSPSEGQDGLGRSLSTLRSVADHVGPSASKQPVREETARGWLGGEIDERVKEASTLIDNAEAVSTEIAQMNERIKMLELFAPLGLELELLSDYENLSVFIGHMRKLGDASEAMRGSGALVFEAKSPDGPLAAVFCPSGSAGPVQKKLDAAQFSSIQAPSGEGNPVKAAANARREITTLEAKKDRLEAEIAEWSAANGGMLVCALEVLENDFTEATAPVKCAVTEHSFIVDGWITSDREEEVLKALSPYCSHIDIDHDVGTQFADHHSTDDAGDSHSEPKPPVDFGDHGPAEPMQLLTDAVGRSDYGRIDPTVFMLITYPLFFGLMLGDMMYGIITISLAAFIYAKTKDSGNEMPRLAVKLLLWIGGATILFGYLYGEFAGFEILPHYACSAAATETAGHAAAAAASAGGCHWAHGEGVPGWAAALSNLYPYAGEFPNGHNLWSMDAKFGIHLAFPFHRVGANLTDLILLTIYMGVIHLMSALTLGVIDEVRCGHGWKGAIYGKVSWMMILGGGFFFCYAFLLIPTHADGEYLGMLSKMQTGGAAILGIGVILLIIHLTHEGVPLPVAAFLGPMEAIGMLPTTISYVRLFAVGVVGVKIAEAGNDMIYQPMAAAFSSGGLGILTGLLLFVAWLSVQAFAWILGMVSPNIHAARLHFVEWMRQFYQAAGERFAPFGSRSKHVEVD